MALTVRELLVELEKYDGDRIVCIGYDDIAEPASTVTEVKATKGRLYYNPEPWAKDSTEKLETIVIIK